MISLTGETWDLASEYPNAECAEVEDDLATIADLLGQVDERNEHLAPLSESAPASIMTALPITIAAARAAFTALEQAERLLADLETYAACSLSVDSQDAAAQRLQGRLEAVRKRFTEAREPLSQFLNRAGDDVVEAYLDDPSAAPSRFQVTHSRAKRHELLPLPEQSLADALGRDGIHAWGRLYDQLAGTLACRVVVNGEERAMGLAAATALMQKPDVDLRERAWRAINATWDAHAEPCCAAINAIAGWRLELCRRRSRRARQQGHPRDVHFLDAPLHDNRLDAATLKTVLAIAEEGKPLARRAARLQAKAYGKTHFGPWDLRAPAPAQPNGGGDAIPYAEAIDLIADAYGDVHPSMGEFVRLATKNRWIEGTVGDRKRPGAYCAGFRKSRTPRIYMTYAGGIADVIILAHELGHAFHSWTLRDLPECQRRYGMAIAETASTFGEAIVRAALLKRARTPGARLAIVWKEAAALTSFLLNIPTRFAFERAFYQARTERPQRPDALKEMMADAWRAWYGDCLAEPDSLFWASKLHFYISGLSFYNFPYLFGYLFSMGVHATRETLGDDFFPRYQSLLQDTGRMTTEALATKHLQADLTRPDFWRATLRHLETRIDAFERLVEQNAPADQN